MREPTGTDESTRRDLRRELLAAMSEGVQVPWSEERFDDLALRIFRYQAEFNPVYRALVEARGMDPVGVSGWRQIPPIPTRAFKEFSVAGSSPEPPQARFRTSGTTGGRERRGEHPIRDLSLYRASLLASATGFLRPEAELRGPDWADRSLRVLALLPDPQERTDSSLAHMAGVLAEAWDDGKGGFFLDTEWRIDHLGFQRALDQSAGLGAPVLLLGTAFAFVRWLDGGPTRTPLPPGSRIMETGGFKGRSREVTRVHLYAALSDSFAVPVERIVNEYGMTELLSQFYEPVISEGVDPGPQARRHVGPPWIRTRVLDPETLEPVQPGRTGLLSHLDLANLDSVSGVLTEDLGIQLPDGFRVLGRVAGAEPRGCSLAMEELLSSTGR